MIDKIQKRHEELLAWKQFYLECSNEWELIKIGHKIEQFETKNFG